MRIIALTGTIASGKSTASKLLKFMRYDVFESDKIAAKLLNKKKVINELSSLYETKIPDLLLKNKKINKVALSDYVFSEKKRIKKLEQYLHPKIRDEEQRFLNICSLNRKKLVFLDIPLLFDNPFNKRCDYVIKMTVNRKIQYYRAMKRPNMNYEKFKFILKKQSVYLSKSTKFKITVVNSGNGKFHVLKNILRVINIVKNSNSRCVWPRSYNHILK